MALIYLLSAQPELPGPGKRGEPLREAFNYASHVAAYAILALFAWRASQTLPMALENARTQNLGIAVFTILYAITDELHQSFVPGREASLLDILADAVGMLLCLATIAALRFQRRARLPDRHG